MGKLLTFYLKIIFFLICFNGCNSSSKKPVIGFNKFTGEAIEEGGDSSLLIGLSSLREAARVPKVKIGKQYWATKNLDVYTYSNGDSIPEVKDPALWNELTTGAWCYYENDPANGETYGKLYNVYAVKDPRGLAPEGWRIPMEEDWEKLSTFLDRYLEAGGKLKEADTVHWESPNTGATNESGFSGLPGGKLNAGERKFNSIGVMGFFWSRPFEIRMEDQTKLMILSRSLNFRQSFFGSNNLEEKDGGSVRLIKAEIAYD